MQSELSKLIHGDSKTVKSNPPASNNNGGSSKDDGGIHWDPFWIFKDPLKPLHTKTEPEVGQVVDDVKTTIEVGAVIAVAGIGLLLYAAYENRHEIESAVKGVAKAGFDIAKVAI